MRILRKRSSLKGPLKLIVFAPFAVAALLGGVVIQDLFDLHGRAAYGPGGVLFALLLLWGRAIDTGVVPGFWPGAETPGSGPARWDTGKSARTVFLIGAAATALLAGVVAWRTQVMAERGYGAGVFEGVAALAMLGAVIAASVALALRRPNVMTLDDRRLVLTGRDNLEIELANIEEVVLRPRTDPYVGVLRLIEPARDIALELGRLSLHPSVFAAELARRRPEIGRSNSKPGLLAASGAVGEMTDGAWDPTR